MMFEWALVLVLAAERGGWAANELDDADPVGTLRAEGKMNAAQEIAAAIRARGGSDG